MLKKEILETLFPQNNLWDTARERIQKYVESDDSILDDLFGAIAGFDVGQADLALLRDLTAPDLSGSGDGRNERLRLCLSDLRNALFAVLAQHARRYRVKRDYTSLGLMYEELDPLSMPINHYHLLMQLIFDPDASNFDLQELQSNERCCRFFDNLISHFDALVHREIEREKALADSSDSEEQIVVDEAYLKQMAAKAERSPEEESIYLPTRLLDLYLLIAAYSNACERQESMEEGDNDSIC